jgi:hypothetical protein
LDGWGLLDAKPPRYRARFASFAASLGGITATTFPSRVKTIIPSSS